MRGVNSMYGVVVHVFVDSGRTTARENSNFSTPEVGTVPLGNSEVTRSELLSRIEQDETKRQSMAMVNERRSVRIMVSREVGNAEEACP